MLLCDAFVKAASRNHTDILKALLNHGMDANIKNRDGWTALIEASCKGNDESIRLLLNYHVDLNLAINNWTPLIYASKYGHIETFHLLFSHGADVDFKTKGGLTVFDFAKTEQVKAILQSNSYVLK